MLEQVSTFDVYEEFRQTLMPRIPEAEYVILTALEIGPVHSEVFETLGAITEKNRITTFRARWS